MYTRLKLDQNISVGTVVTYNPASEKWEQATNQNNLVGIVNTAPAQAEGDDFFTAEVHFSGVVYAIASRDIPNEGGMMFVEAGGIYVDTEATQSCGVVAPAPYTITNLRVAGTYVMVHLK